MLFFLLLTDVVKNVLDLLNTELLLLANLLNVGMIDLGVNTLFIPSCVLPSPINKLQSLSNVSLADSAIKLATWYF